MGDERRVQRSVDRADFVAKLGLVARADDGSIRSSSLKSTGLPFASSFAARFLVAAIRACCDDGILHRAVASSRPSAPLRTIGAV
ncbi:hypothetical protein CQ10_39185 [Bradyrhizobium valentinum]|uniref:Uncharacterized protein n=1 Tax=Bradyrhizobium valentinum TaxID=1518501 RepID=A0A0R3LAQ9_9BRAD|nr:hypothetical protein CP49_21305 [Bradyrhizobium valentinum]KRR12990.1 hypothetical protein CQ10_39185 [Bradyrhizobium valentinum]